MSAAPPPTPPPTPPPAPPPAPPGAPPGAPPLTGETLPVGAMLAVTAGLLDAYTYQAWGGVFATAQTGNIVLLALEVAHQRWATALPHLPPLLAFLAGVIVVERLRQTRLAPPYRDPARAVLLLAAAVLAGVGFLPAATPAAAVTVIVSFTAALLMAMFRTVLQWSYSPAVMTTNVVLASRAAFDALVGHDPPARRMARTLGTVIVAFFGGALGGAILTDRFGGRTAWVAAGLLLLTALLFSGTARWGRAATGKEG